MCMIGVWLVCDLYVISVCVYDKCVNSVCVWLVCDQCVLSVCVISVISVWLVWDKHGISVWLACG